MPNEHVTTYRIESKNIYRLIESIKFHINEITSINGLTCGLAIVRQKKGKYKHPPPPKNCNDSPIIQYLIDSGNFYDGFTEGYLRAALLIVLYAVIASLKLL